MHECVYGQQVIAFLDNQQPSTNNRLQSHNGNLNEPRLFGAEGQVISAQAELDGVTERGAADDFDSSAVAEAHLKESPAQFGIAPHGYHMPASTNAEFAQGADRHGSHKTRR